MTSQHQAVVPAGTLRAAGTRPTPGPIAVLPKPPRADADGVESSRWRQFTRTVREAGGEPSPLSADTRGLVWLSYPQAAELGDTLAANPQIEWVQLPWAGVDAFAPVLAEHSRPTLLWTSAKGAYAQPVAEHTLALILALLRVLPKRARATRWNPTPEGRSLYGRNVVIIGAGGIARELMRLLAPFGALISIVRRSSVPMPGAVQTVQTDALHAVLRTADVVVVAAALTGPTLRVIGAPELSLLPAEAVLVNVARGPLVDTAALVTTLAAGGIAGAALDVTEPEPLPEGHPLWREPRCLITPHMADTPDMTAPLLAERIRLNVRAFLGDGDFVGIVDPDLGY
jgi:phosphoglycerate dehydrogenase-like enzyme